MGAPSAGSAWTATINDRKLASARSIPAPRLLIVGGSGALFGIQARQLEATLHLPTRNLASHAALGTAVILDLARRTATRGDTLLLIPEYELYDYGDSAIRAWADPVYLDYLLAAEPARLRQLPPADLAALVLRIPSARLAEGWRNRLQPPAPLTFRSYHPYDPANVDDHGDMTGHRAARLSGKPRRSFPISETLAHGLVNRSGFRELTAFCGWAKANGIRVLAALPVICDDPAYHGPKTAQTVAEIEAYWRSAGIPLVAEFPTSLLPRDDFFDTQYHLTEEAAARRTAILATALKPHLSAP